ncbi:MAG: rane protein [Paenibacillaceae bacterium]|jgi:uncharacterized membrane protein YgaE (UPF0421/DUF939 family)|nr:rane protein [Paenibacillaceae bacterium]
MVIRVVKTAAAVFIAIALARAAHLDYALSCGLIAVLGIDITLKKSLQSVLVRIAASLTGLAMATVIFWGLGFHLWSISLFVLIVFPVLLRFRLGDGFVVSSVLVFHIVDKQAVTLLNVGNEVLLLVIGMGTACLVNLIYMPRADKQLAGVKGRVDELFTAIFIHMADHLRDPQTVWDGRELLEAPDVIKEGQDLARRASENKLFQSADSWSLYFEMRRQHFDSIQRMIDLLAQVYQTLPHGAAVALLFSGLSEGVKSEYYAGHVESSLLRLEREFKGMALPATREEFEMRSALLQLCLELRTYLTMSKKGKKPMPPGQELQAEGG